MILNSSYYRTRRLPESSDGAQTDRTSELLNKLTETKRERIRAEEEAHVLDKNIQMLIYEELKAQKQANLLKKKTEELLETRKAAQLLVMMKEQARLQKQMETANQYVKNKHNREENLMNKSAVFAYYRNMIDNVGKVIRKQIEEGHECHQKEIEEHIVGNCKKALKVKSDEMKGFENRVKFMVQHYAVSKETYEEKINTERKRKEQTLRRMGSLENLRQELIQRLNESRSSQLLETQRYNEIKNTRFYSTFRGPFHVPTPERKEIASMRESFYASQNQISTGAFTTKRSKRSLGSPHD